MLLWLVAAGTANADLEWTGGTGPPFVFTADGRGSGHPGDTLFVMVGVGARVAGAKDIQWQLDVPAELHLISGETSGKGAPETTQGVHTLVLVPRTTGAFEIRGQMHLTRADAADDAALSMPVVVTADTVTWEHSLQTRAEGIRAGRRYRYGDWWLVPIGASELPVLDRDLERAGVKAKRLVTVPVVCGDCAGVNQRDTVNVVVSIDSQGKVSDFTLLPKAGARNQPLVQSRHSALESAVKAWRFEPARFRGQTVSDWQVVPVILLARPGD